MQSPIKVACWKCTNIPICLQNKLQNYETNLFHIFRFHLTITKSQNAKVKRRSNKFNFETLRMRKMELRTYTSKYVVVKFVSLFSLIINTYIIVGIPGCKSEIWAKTTFQKYCYLREVVRHRNHEKKINEKFQVLRDFRFVLRLLRAGSLTGWMLPKSNHGVA